MHGGHQLGSLSFSEKKNNFGFLPQKETTLMKKVVWVGVIINSKTNLGEKGINEGN